LELLFILLNRNTKKVEELQQQSKKWTSQEVQ
jgi:hypothetical protein